jgi:hypothetical protein
VKGVGGVGEWGSVIRRMRGRWEHCVSGVLCLCYSRWALCLCSFPIPARILQKTSRIWSTSLCAASFYTASNQSQSGRGGALTTWQILLLQASCSRTKKAIKAWQPLPYHQCTRPAHSWDAATAVPLATDHRPPFPRKSWRGGPLLPAIRPQPQRT